MNRRSKAWRRLQEYNDTVSTHTFNRVVWGYTVMNVLFFAFLYAAIKGWV